MDVIDFISEKFSEGDVLFSLMSQYTPQPGAVGPLARHVTRAEYRAAAAYMENCGIRFTDIRPGFVATPLLSGDGRYPMLMRTEKVAARIMHVLRHPRRRVVIDRRYALMVFFWKLIPEWLWERLNIRKDD